MHTHTSLNFRLAVVFGSFGLALSMLVLPGPAEGQVFVLALPGSCTGEVSAAFAGATPGGSVEVYRSTSAGADAVPSGPCAGTALGLAEPQLETTVAADGSGGFSTTRSALIGACSELYQTVDLTICAVSNVARLVSGFPAPVPETGQDLSYERGDDGDLERGVSWPDPRFTDSLDGTVTDNLTGLIWLHYANCFSFGTWFQALEDANGLADGQCGLTDGSAAGDWRLPNRFELESLLDLRESSPALPAGHPFSDLVPTFYWSSTTFANALGDAWTVGLIHGYTDGWGKFNESWIWPVRGGQ